MPFASPSLACSRKCRCSPCIGIRNCGFISSCTASRSGRLAWPDTWYWPMLSSTTSTPISLNLLATRPTEVSLPGMVFEENRNISPSRRVMPLYLPLAICADPARRSPCEPVTRIIRFWRSISLASSDGIVGGKSVKTPVAWETAIIFFIDRPITTTVRPASTPAWARVFRRATFDANVVATTRPLAVEISALIGFVRVASDRPGSGENTLVLSQTSARTPSLATDCQSTGSNASPTCGLPSSLKSPECTIRPDGVSITKAELSGIECATGRKLTLKGPASIT